MFILWGIQGWPWRALNCHDLTTYPIYREILSANLQPQREFSWLLNHWRCQKSVSMDIDEIQTLIEWCIFFALGQGSIPILMCEWFHIVFFGQRHVFLLVRKTRRDWGCWHDEISDDVGDRSVGSIPDVPDDVPFFALESDKNGWFINWWCTVRDFCAHASILLVYTPLKSKKNTELEVCQPLNPSKSPILGVPKHLRSFLFLGTWEHHQRPHCGARARRFLSSTWEHSHRTVFELGGRILHVKIMGCLSCISKQWIILYSV